MMDWTDRHCRYFLRLVSPSALLYTEMVTAAALNHGDAPRLLAFDPAEHPVAIQLGGADPAEMAAAARSAAEHGYDEVNINVGCPSDRVQSGRFGACLMAQSATVRDCVAAMREAVAVPVTVKCRIGIDERDDYGFLRDFVGTVAEGGCEVFVVHARKAVLGGLSPKQNREVPPLRYDHVFRLKRDFPGLTVVLNGGLRSLATVREALREVDGVMIGREAYQNPWFLAELEREITGGRPPASREAVAEAMMPYIRAQLAAGERLQAITRHVLGLFAGQPGARAWRRTLSEGACRPDAGPELLERAMAHLGRAA